jgi:hypothetical protein
MVQDFPSKGMASRVYGEKAQRVHHLFSNNELCYFYALDWSDKVIDIKEQFPLLDLEMSLRIAGKLGVAHPYDNASGFPYVLTSDFMIVTMSGIKVRTIKMADELKKRRVAEKLEIERIYWQEQNVDWGIVTERELNKHKAYNIEWLAQAKNLTDFSLDGGLSEMLTARFLECCANLDMTYADIADKIEEEFDLSKGIGLCVLKHLAYRKKIAVDINSSQLRDDLSTPKKLAATGGM